MLDMTSFKTMMY